DPGTPPVPDPAAPPEAPPTPAPAALEDELAVDVAPVVATKDDELVLPLPAPPSSLEQAATVATNTKRIADRIRISSLQSGVSCRVLSMLNSQIHVPRIPFMRRKTKRRAQQRRCSCFCAAHPHPRAP